MQGSSRDLAWGPDEKGRVAVLTVWVDADACPRNVLACLRRLQPTLGFQLRTVSSSAHHFDDPQHLVVDAEPQATDLAIANRLRRGDIVVTQDYGLAAVALGKGAGAISPTGRIFRQETMPFLLEQRNLFARHRRGGGRTRGPAARTAADDQRFEQSFRRLLKEIQAGRA